MYCVDKQEKGFTLIELMVTLVIALVILAGMVAVFISQTRAAHTVGSKTELMGDLYLASQIMQSELRGAKAICWDAAGKRLVYQPIDSAANITNACNSVAGANGWFKFTSAAPVKICWDRAGIGGGCQELLRGLSSATGLVVTPTTNTAADLIGVRTISLTAVYQDSNHANQDLNLKLKVWPRNQ